jgi:hypothetical protein
MENVEVQFETPDDEDSSHNLIITMTLACGVVLKFEASNGELYTAEEYQKFGAGELKYLEFNDRNGHCGIYWRGSVLSFETSHHSDSSSFLIPARLCVELCQKLVEGRGKIHVEPPVDFSGRALE